MNAAARTLLLAALLGGAGCVTPTDPFAPMHPRWHDYSSSQSRHFVNFPGKATESLKETKIVSGQTVSTYLREFRATDRYYGTAWTPVPNAPSNAEGQARLLEIAAAEAVKTSPGAKLVSKEKVTLDGINGLAYVIDQPQAKVRVRQQVFLVSGVLVEQTYAGPAGTEFEREPGRFFNSLKLLP